jgi:hypothetical protein
MFMYLVVVGVFIDYYTPSKRLVTVNGGEVKRVDEDGIITADNPADGPTRDVYFVFTSTTDNKNLVYRNEDTGWGFPPYLKFDSADLQASINILDRSKKPVVISSYGYRIQMFSMFPNIVRIQDSNATKWSFVRVLAFSVYVVLALYFSFRLKWFLLKQNVSRD